MSKFKVGDKAEACIDAVQTVAELLAVSPDGLYWMVEFFRYGGKQVRTVPIYQLREHKEVLCQVEGKDVHVGDILYGKWNNAAKKGYVISGLRDGFPADGAGWRLTTNLSHLTWTKPEEPKEFLYLSDNGIRQSPLLTEEQARAHSCRHGKIYKLVPWTF